jgi:predicted nucleic acid-binding protein
LILLDTNLVSAMMNPRYDPIMADFHQRYSLNELYLPSIVIAEIRFGIRRLPIGRRRSEVEQDFELFLTAGFGSRIVVFDAACANGYATARVMRQEAGRPVAVEDAMIGGMALAFGATLATRNIRDFDGYGLSLLNPWELSENR